MCAMGGEKVNEQPDSRDDEVYHVISLVTKVRAVKEILRGTGSEDNRESELLQAVKYSLTKLEDVLSDKYEKLYQRINR